MAPGLGINVSTSAPPSPYLPGVPWNPFESPTPSCIHPWGYSLATCGIMTVLTRVLTLPHVLGFHLAWLQCQIELPTSLFTLLKNVATLAPWRYIVNKIKSKAQRLPGRVTSPHPLITLMDPFGVTLNIFPIITGYLIVWRRRPYFRRI